jgi:hypothetical protein
LPVVDTLSAEYADRVDFIAPAWKSSFELTEARAEELFVAEVIQWGLDDEEVIFGLYGVPYQPVTVLIGADRTVVEAWAGGRPAEDIRASLDELINVSG